MTPQHLDRRDAAVAAASAAATALVVILQNRRLTVLWDLSYILENATRMAGGDVPYRDFPFPYAPLTFAVQAAIIRLFGRAVWHHIAYAAVAGGIATALTYFVVRRFTGRWSSAMLITPLIPLGIYSIFPHPFYDPDACLAVLVIAVLLLYGDSPKARFATGATSVVPLFVKQNIGLAFIVALAGCVVISRDRRRAVPLLGGIAAGCAIGAVTVGSVFGFENYIHWTIRFAASRRLPPVGQYMQIYTEAIVWWWIAAAVAGGFVMKRVRPAGAALVAAPFIWTIYRIFVTDDPTEREVNLLRFWPMIIVCGIVAGAIWMWRERSLRGIVPLLAVGTIAGAFLSQSAWGSSYGIWPMLVIVIAAGVAAICDGDARLEGTLSGVIAAALLFGGVPYILGNERLTYVKLDGPLRQSRLPPLRGLRERGEWLPEFEQLVAWTDANIPRSDGILCLPGEDLFYFTTGRRPHFPVLMFDRTVNPFDAATIAHLAGERGIRWVIVKKRLQMNGAPMENLGETMRLLEKRFVRAVELPNYVIYERTPNRVVVSRPRSN